MDTAAKRFTAQLVSLPFRGIATPPDSVSSPGDRVALAYQYSGLVEAATPTAEFVRLTNAEIAIAYGSGSIAIPYSSGLIAAAVASGSIRIP